MSKKNLYNVGIYQIKNNANGMVYIGQSMHLYKRKSEHFSRLRKNKHDNKHLQNAFNKYGSENFIFEILLYCEEFELTKYENAIKNINKDHCYNIRECADSNKGLKHTEQFKKEVSERNKGNTYWLGKHHTEATKELMSKNNGMLGKHHTDETRLKMSENHADFSNGKHPNYGKTYSDEARKNMSENHADVSGKNNPNYKTGRYVKQ
jgi:predicted GIY-YIG superfamily endonuclease